MVECAVGCVLAALAARPALARPNRTSGTAELTSHTSTGYLHSPGLQERNRDRLQERTDPVQFR